jgi:uncharacterized membrane protein YkgB
MADDGTHWGNRLAVTLAWRALRGYAWLIGYRFVDYLSSRAPIGSSTSRASGSGPQNAQNGTLGVPTFLLEKGLDIAAVQEKARGSLAASGVFFGLSVAVLAALIGAPDTRNELHNAWVKGPFFCKIVIMTLSVVFPYLVIRQERSISKASLDAKDDDKRRDKYRRQRYAWFVFWFILSFLLFLAVPFVFIHWLSVEDDLFSKAFSLSGFVLVIFSAFFLLFGLEFYDSASGWRWRGRKSVGLPSGDSHTSTTEDRRRRQEPVALHFHLASVASHSTLIGVSLALIGLSLLLCLVHLWLGTVTACVTLFVLILMTEVERSLWDAQPQENKPQQEAGDSEGKDPCAPSRTE